MKRRALQSLYRSGISRILSGSLLGQGVLLGVSPLLTRLYTPADFAALAVFTALATILGSIATLSWERAIVIPRSEAQARSVLGLGLLSVLVLSSATAAAAYFLGTDLDALFGVHVFADLWWLLPSTVAVFGLFQLLSAWLIRMQAYGQIAARNVFQGLSQAISTVSLGFLGVGTGGLISGAAVGRTVGLLGVVPWRSLRPANGQSWARFCTVARRYKRFPLIATWSRSMNILGLQLPAILIVAFYGVWEAGMYALTVKVLATPIGIVTTAVSEYFEGVFSGRLRSHASGLSSMVLGISGRLAVIAILPTLTVVLLGPVIFEWTFGQEWRKAGEFARVVVVFYAFQFAISPISRVLLVLEKQFLQLTWDVFRMVLMLLAILLPVALGGTLIQALIGVAASQTVAYTVLLWICFREARRAELPLTASLP
ncbi:lipopolysaccharide biosynthesis protein [Nesterenkonia sp. DZ6]|uniref:lipopolysaccharide biosynthesis protein n=1 Tax=Nesterenkonia sp. DZ6 TaxID=2901229 RepID=UPI001F4C66CF|nr:oligosaccharide flippase family protein [Nesterenkonia sp. DZ6]MCH8559406.1 oligosaccharide flippase family protein [Nesterenkonia sp. DZ6]